MYKDFGTHMNGLVLGDATGRRGLGKLRHLDTNYVWIQEKAAKGDLNFKKVAGVDNGADLLTKTLSWNEIQSHIHNCKIWVLPATENWQHRLEQT